MHPKFFEMKTRLFSLHKVLFVLLLLLAVKGWGQTYTATYTVTTTTAVTSAGTLPAGSVAVYSQSFGTVKQITSGNNAMLTLSGYQDKKISAIILRMRSNASAGAGNLDMAVGLGTYPTGYSTIYSIATSNFNSTNWNGSYTTTYTNITKNLASSYTVQNGEKVVIRINATTNSLYVEEFSIIYENVASCAAPSVALQTTPIQNISTTAADFYWIITDVGGGTKVTTRGFQYTKNSDLSSPTNLFQTGDYSTGTYNLSTTATALTANTQYYYRAYAINDCTTPQTGYSHTSGYLTFTTLPNAPTADAATAISATGFTANWYAPTPGTAAFTYTLEYSTDNTFATGVVSTSNISSSSQVVNGLNPSTTYFYRVRAVNITGPSVWSDVITVTTSPATPTINLSGTLNPLSTTYGTASSFNTFSVSANYLTGTSLTVSAPLGFEISNDGGTSYGTSRSLTINASGNVANTTFRIRLAATTVPGPYSGNITATDGTTSATPLTHPSSTVSQKPLSITGLSAQDKIYNGNTSAALNTATMALSGGIVGTDIVTISGTAVGTFADKNFGIGKAVTISGLGLGGAQASYYILNPITGITANIDKKPLTISPPTIATKTYNGSPATGTVTPGTLSDLIGTETLNVSATGTFTGPNAADAGTNKPATVVYALANGTNGGLAINYSLADGAGTGNIDKRDPTITNTAISLTVGGTYTIPTTISDSDGALTYVSNDLSVATVNVATVTGVAVGSTTLSVTQAESTNYNAVTTAAAISIPVNVSEDDAVAGDYRTNADNLDWTSLSLWQVKNSSGGWDPATSIPDNGSLSTVFPNSIYIKNKKITLNLTNLRNYKSIIIDKGGELIKSGQNLVIAANGKLLIKDDGSYVCNSVTTIDAAATFEIEDHGNFTLNFGTSNQLSANIFKGTEKFHPNSKFTINTAPTVTGTSLRALIRDFTVLTPYNNIGYFGNIIFETAGNAINLVLAEGTNNSLANATDYAIAAGDIIYKSGTSSSRLIHVDNSQTNTTVSSQTKPYKIGGSLIVESGYTGMVQLRNTPVATHFKIGNNIELANGTSFAMQTIAPAPAPHGAINLYVDGDIKIAGNGSLQFATAISYSAAINMYLKGSINAASSSVFTNSNTTTNNSNLFFTGTNIQKIDIANQATISKINFIANDKSYVQFVNEVVDTDNNPLPKHDIAFSKNSTFTVKTGATLDFGSNGTGAINLVRASSETNQTFTAENGSTLKITSPDGIIDGATSPDTEKYKGNVQIGASAASRSFGLDATYHYIGKTDQVTGNGLPADASGKTVIVQLVNPASKFWATPVSGAGSVKRFNSSGKLEIKNGIVLDGQNPDIPAENYGRFADAVDTNATAAQSGNLTMSGGRYILYHSNNFAMPHLSGTYDLTGGVIQFDGNQQSIRAPKTYLNVEVTGTDVGTPNGNISMKDTGLFTVKENGSFLINNYSLVGESGTSTLTVENKGVFRTGDEQGFSGSNQTSVQPTITTINLNEGSVVEYMADGIQTITNQTIATPSDAHYANLKISGTDYKTAKAGTTKVKQLTTVTAGAKLKVPEGPEFIPPSTPGTPNVFYAQKGIKNEGGEFLLENNAQLMQDDTGVINTGNIKAERKVTDMDNTLGTQIDYVYWSAPVTGQILRGATGFSPGTATNRFFEYHESDDYFYSTPDVEFQWAKGYAIRAEESAGYPPNATGYNKTYSFTGTPNNGDKTIIVKRSANVGPVLHGYNLIGNPYPSNINFDQLYDNNSNVIYATAWLWTNNTYEYAQQGSNYSGNNYAVYNKTGGNNATYQPSGAPSVKPNGIIKVGQGFMVQVQQSVPVGTANLQFKNSYGLNKDLRVTDNETFYQRNPIQKDRYWLQLLPLQELSILK